MGTTWQSGPLGGEAAIRREHRWGRGSQRGLNVEGLIAGIYEIAWIGSRLREISSIRSIMGLFTDLQSRLSFRAGAVGWCAEGQLPKVRSTSATGRTMRGSVGLEGLEEAKGEDVGHAGIVEEAGGVGMRMRGEWIGVIVASEVFGDAAGSPLAGGAGFAGVFEGGAEVGGRAGRRIRV